MAIAGFRHLGLKIVSIGLAALLWALVSGEQVVERALRIPLEFTNVPVSLELVGDAPTAVDVRVRGSSGALGRIAAGELVAVLDLRRATTGRGQLFHLTDADVRSPFDVQVVQVAPSTIAMSFERASEKRVPIVPAFDGEPAAGFVVGAVTSNPPMVMIVGPESVVATVTEARTEPVSVNGVSASFVDTVTVGSPDPTVRLREPVVAQVSVSISAAPVEMTVDAVPVQVRNAGRPTQVFPRQVTVFARGPRDGDGVSPSDFDASVDVAGLRAGQFDLEVRVVPPSKVGVTRVEPSRVKVTIR
jgi:YbbR domain-containing protein